MSSRRSSSSGEINAIKGYNSQYKAGLLRILRLIKNNNFKKLHIVDFNAKSVDDFVIFTKDMTTEAYQVKNIESQPDIRYNDFCNKSNGDGYIKQFSKAWLSLKTHYPDYTPKLYLMTNQYPSDNPNAYLPDSSMIFNSREKTFSNFIEEVWLVRKRAMMLNEPFITASRWEEAYKKWEITTNLKKNELDDFFNSVIFLFNNKLPNQTDLDDIIEKNVWNEIYIEFLQKIDEANSQNINYKPVQKIFCNTLIR